MLPTFVLQQQSTGEEIYRENTDLTLRSWQKKTAKKVLRLKRKVRFHEAIQKGDYIASWYGPDYDNFMRTADKETSHKICDHVFKEYSEDRLTQDELFAILHKVSEANKKKPLKVKKKQRKYYETYL